MNFDRPNDAIRELNRLGLEVLKSRAGHYKIFHEGRMIAVMSKNMNDARGWKNVKSYIRRAAKVSLR